MCAQKTIVYSKRKMDFSVFENYGCEGQLSIFDILNKETPYLKFSPDTKFHVIECFGGIGSQAMAFERLGVDFTSTLIEFDKYPVASYNAIHGTNFEPTDITKIHAQDLEIDKGRLNILCYSFPCQDVSVAGLGKSLEKGSGTRSGLLWEVERLLDECEDDLPEILLMENVKNLLSKKHKEHFDNPDFYNFLYEIDDEIYLIRIRKLTPKECWSLMDFNDGSYERAEKVNSNTQLYKEAGNSIVVNCLVAIFGQMIEGKEDLYKNI